MSSPSTRDRNGGRWVLPVSAAVAVAVALLFFTKCTGGDPAVKRAADKPTASASTIAPVKTTTDTIKGSGTAPAEIAIKEASVVRTKASLGMAALIPKFKLAEVEKVTLRVEQGSDVYLLSVVRDVRGVLINPRLVKGEGVGATDLACNNGTLFRVNADRFSIALPLECLDKPEDELRARMSIVSLDGVTEETGLTKSLKAPK